MDLDISEKEVLEIKRTWKIPMADPLTSGETMLLKLFERYPANQKKFQDLKDLPFKDLKDSPKFKFHSVRIMKAFDEAIQSLGTQNAGMVLHEIFEKVAVSHHKRGISKESHNQLKEVIIETLVGVCDLNDFQKGAWEKVMESIFNVIYSENWIL
uniref:Globin domain-containing protein n=1 Tax=Megaselia scalaris TaxID=36166 RepID=T1GF38_MEGSC